MCRWVTWGQHVAVSVDGGWQGEMIRTPQVSPPSARNASLTSPVLVCCLLRNLECGLSLLLLAQLASVSRGCGSFEYGRLKARGSARCLIQIDIKLCLARFPKGLICGALRRKWIQANWRGEGGTGSEPGLSLAGTQTHHLQTLHFYLSFVLISLCLKHRVI